MTLSDVAKKAGVSIVTASRVMNRHPRVRENLRRRVLDCAEELGYSPNLLARGLVKCSSRLVALYVSKLDNPFFGAIAEKVTMKFRDMGYEALLCSDSDQHFHLHRSFSAAGSVLVSMADPSSLRKLSSSGGVLVGVNSYHPREFRFPNILFDFDSSYVRICEMLFGAGRRRIAFVSHVQPEYQKRKFLAAREFIRKSGGEIVAPESLESFRSPQELVSFMRAAGGAQLPQAVFCENDILAIELHSIIASQGSPHGVRIIGCDGVIPFQAIWSVKIDIGATAAAAAELFEKSLDGQAMPEKLPKITTEPIFN